MNTPDVEILDVRQLTSSDWQDMHAWRNASTVYDNPMFEPELVRLVDSVRPDVKVLKIKQDATVAGFWPILLRPGGWARPVLGPFSDWHGPILAPEVISSLDAKTILRASLIAGGTFPSVPAALAGLDAIAHDVAAIIDLRSGWDTYEAVQRKEHPKFFKKLGRLERKLEREIGPVVYDIDCESEDAFEWLLASKAHQYESSGLHNVLKADWAQAFLRGLRTLRTDRFAAKLSKVTANGRLVAAEFNMWSDKIVHGWITAYDNEFYPYSPGHLISTWILKQSALLGRDFSDWGPGHMSYKRFVMNDEAEISAVRVSTEQAIRPGAAVWSAAERMAPGGSAKLFERIRRRSDQICASEPVLKDRVSGHVSALLRFNKR